MHKEQLLQSDWFIRMLKKSAIKPQDRLLNLFPLVEDWLDAPNIDRKSLLQSNSEQHSLQDFLTLEAAKAGAEMPEVLANQLYFMVIAAAQEKLKNQNLNSFAHARNAAHAIITTQTKSSFVIRRPIAYGLCASLVIGILATTLIVFNQKLTPTTSQVASTVQDDSLVNMKTIDTNSARSVSLNVELSSPTKTAALFARIEQMRKGDCQLIEAIQLPDKYKSIYFENIVMGHISTNPSEQLIVNELLDKVRCNYTPMLMVNSVN
jgi:hypothetical protein